MTNLTYHNSYLRLLNLIWLSCLILFIGACSNKIEPELAVNEEQKAGQFTFRGSAAKGPLSGSTISVYALDSVGNKTGAALAQTTTVNGSWTITVVNPNEELLLVESEGGEYIDESDSEPDITKKRRISLQAGEVLQSILIPGQSTASINFFTDTLVKSLRKEVFLAADLVQAFNRVRSRAYNALGFDPFTEIPTDPIQPDVNATETEKTYALLIGGAAYAINNAAIKTGETQITYDMLDAMAKDFADCELDGYINGFNVSLLLSLPSDLYDDIDIVTEATRFRNNNYEQYTNATLPSWNQTEFCEPMPALTRVLPSQLIGLTLSSGAMNPSFEVSTKNYDVAVPYEVSSITLTPVADTLSSSILVKTNAVVSGQVSPSLTLNVGLNVIDIVIIAEDGVTQTDYVLNITRNDAPVFSSGSNISVQENTTAIGNVVALDNDGGTVTYSKSGGADESLFSIDATSGALAFTATRDFETPVDSDTNNTYLVDITASDSINSVTLNMVVTVTDNNDELPTATNNTINTNEDVDHVFTLSEFNFSDLDSGNTLNHIKITSLESVGSLKVGGSDVLLNQIILASEINVGNFKFVPVPDANGVAYDNFSFQVYDGLNYSSNSYVMTLNVDAVNDNPIAVAETFYTATNNFVLIGNVMLNDTDVDADTISLATVGDVTSTAGANVSNYSAGTFSYMPTTNYTGTDTFSYTISDGNGGTATGTVTVIVSADTDSDGISDQEEIDVFGSNINSIDSDGDGFTDYHEVIALNSNTALTAAGEFPAGTTISTVDYTISSPTTFTLANSPYWIQNNLIIANGGSLTIEAGVALKFTTGASSRLEVQNGGTLITQPGLHESYLTSVEDDTYQGDTSNDGYNTSVSWGVWQGLIAYGGSIVNIDNLGIHHARYGVDAIGANLTANNIDIVNCSNSGLYLSSAAVSNISNVTLSGSLASVTVDETSDPSTFTNVNFNGGYLELRNRVDIPTTIGTTNVDFTNANINLTALKVFGTLATGTHNMVADPFISTSSLWYMTGDLTIPSGSTLNVADGAIIKGSSISTDIDVQGTLNLNGTGNGIKITSLHDDLIGGDTDGYVQVPTDQDWGGINYRTGSAGTITNTELWYAHLPLDLENSLPSIDGLTIKDAGNVGMEMYTTGSGIMNSTPVIKNVTIDITDDYGLYIRNTSTAGNYAVFENLNITSPGFDGIRMENSGPGAINPSFGINAGSSTVNAGTVYSSVSLSGGSTNPTFSSITMNGGLYSYSAENGASGDISTSILDGGTIAGIHLSDGSNPAFNSGNTISNTPAPVAVNSQDFIDAGSPGISGATLTSVTNQHVLINGTITSPMSLTPDPLGATTDYIVDGDTTIASTITIAGSEVLHVKSGTLTIDPNSLIILGNSATLLADVGTTVTINDGAVVKSDAIGSLQLSGTVNINGTATNRVVFTSLDDDSFMGDTDGDGTATPPASGQWNGVICTGSAVCTINHAHFLYAIRGLKIASTASASINNSIFDDNQMALQITSNGEVDVTNSIFINNGPTAGENSAGIDLTNSTSATSTSEIKHNYFFKNNGINGGAIYSASANNPKIINNLIIDNDASTSAAGIFLDTSASTTIEHNSLIYNNIANATDNMAGGIRVQDNPGGSPPYHWINNNIIWNNKNNVPLDDDFHAVDIADISAFNNLTKDGSLTGNGNVTAAEVYLDKHYYLATSPTASPALDVGSIAYSSSVINTDYASAGTTNVDGSTDSGTIDIGFHYAQPAKIADVTNSILTVETTSPATSTNVLIQFLPRDAAALDLGAGWTIQAVNTDGTLDGTIGPVIDRGTGVYEVIYTSAATSAMSDTVELQVEGVPIKSVVISTP